MTTLTYAERIAVWRHGNPDKQLTFDLLREICDATNLMGANLMGADLWGANLWRANLSGANLSGANLRYANLRGADLRGADLRGADLWDANLSGVDLRGANFSDADLSYTNLSGANFSGADLRGANFRGATLLSANLRDTNWQGLQVTGLPSGQFILTPTPDGWQLQVGCWFGTPKSLAELIAKDDDWPEAEGDEIERRRPGLQAVLNLIEAHTALYPTLIDELKERCAKK